MVRLTTCGDPFEARLLAARLGSEGIIWSLRGGHDGPFAVGAVDVLVDADDLETAQEMLADDTELDVDAAVNAAGVEGAASTATSARDLVVLVAVLVLVALFAFVRMGARV
jgi:hypothetical protein